MAYERIFKHNKQGMGKFVILEPFSWVPLSGFWRL
jgi:hypothetical protein